ncbi:MAG: hypothetical protein HOP29_12470 [Phycisphaerales bacterium]|nr:hypothetical protein [Phycisphaerales bacterium]
MTCLSERSTHRQAVMTVVAGAIIVFGVLTSRAVGAVVLWTAPNTTVTLGLAPEYENPLTGYENVQGYHVVDWRDADYQPFTPTPYDDWTNTGIGTPDGMATEVWMRFAGQKITTTTTVPGRIVSVHLMGDGNDGIAEVHVDGAVVARIDMGSSPAQRAFILVEELALGLHTIDVLDLGAGAFGQDVATFGAAVLEPKWYQPPEPLDPNTAFTGWNEISTVAAGQIVADDFRCDTSDPITAIRWWGSFIGWQQPAYSAEMPDSFHLAIWTDVPAGVDESFSHPGQVVWEAICTTPTMTFAGWDISPIDGTVEAAFEFVCNLPSPSWFHQPAGDNLLWLSIDAQYMIPVIPPYPWGWKTRPRDINSLAPDDAVRVFDPVPANVGATWGGGQPIEWPMPGDSWDMAFELIGSTGVSVIKWNQPPEFVPPDCHYGWDEWSVYGSPQIVADDWICTDDNPVTDITWWGSYRGWLNITPPPGAPDGFRITVWTDAPSPPEPFSHPVNKVHEWWVPRDQTFETWVGWDCYPTGGPPTDATFLYTFDIPENEWFMQSPPGASTVYWISVAATYPVSIPCACDGDFNHNGMVDATDVTTVLDCIPMLPPPVGRCALADLNCDGVVNAMDLQIVLCQFQQLPNCCTQPTAAEFVWGWKTRPWMGLAPDAAVRMWPPYVNTYFAGEPITTTAGEWDTAFALISSAPGEPFTKWSQPPVRYTGERLFNGWNQLSIYNDPINGLAADDWVCTGQFPVTGVQWWGSFIAWGEVTPPQVPDAFHMAIWTDVPAGIDGPFSHPGEVVWEYRCETFTWVFEGYDIDPRGLQPGLESCYRFECTFPDAAEFRQPSACNVYWISIAVDDPFMPPDPLWGWKTRPHVTNAPDDAVRIRVPQAPTVGSFYALGEPLWWPTPADSWDLAFVLKTTGLPPTGACCPDQPGDPCLDNLTAVECASAGGNYMGDASVCGPVGACCDATGNCSDWAEICCAPPSIHHGAGSACTQRQGCCLPDGTCVDLDPLCCADLNGAPQGAPCSAATIACCLQDGSGDCRNVDPLCCDDLGGIPSPSFEPACLGDPNGNGIDDACERTQACCLPDASCQDLRYDDCVAAGGDPQGPTTDCTTGVICQPIKWAQPPLFSPASPHPECFYGWDEPSMFGRPPWIVADDWLCVDPRPVADIHWWGSYIGWQGTEPPTNAADSFHIGIWTDVPAGVILPWSHPGVMLREWIIPRAATNERPVACDFHPGHMIQPDGCFRYDVTLPQSQWFFQNPAGASTIYWISIAALGGPACPCDGNVDGVGGVDLADLLMVINCIGQPPVGPCARADVDCNGVIDQADANAVQCLTNGQPPQVCCPNVEPAAHPWGWKTRPRFFMDDAIRISAPLAPQPGMPFEFGEPIEDPPGVSWDAAFVLTTVLALPCDDDQDCDDLNVCTYDDCQAGLCTNLDHLYGDVNNTGDVDIFDILCVLDGFAGDYSICAKCNVDIMSCDPPDGVVDIFDILAVLDAFAGVDPCCSGASVARRTAPDAGAALRAGDRTARAGVTLSRVRGGVRPGESFVIDVFVHDVADLRGGQVVLNVTGGDGGELVVESAGIDAGHADHVFATGRSFDAFDRHERRVVNVLSTGGVTVKGSAYLTTFRLRASADARGSFRVTTDAERTVLVDANGAVIETTRGRGVVVNVR